MTESEYDRTGDEIAEDNQTYNNEMKQQAHVFLRDSHLFVTTEMIPEKPIMHKHTPENYTATVYVTVGSQEAYTSDLASIRERAVKVSSPITDEILKAIGVLSIDEFGNYDYLKGKENTFFPLDCEVRYEKRAICNRCNMNRSNEWECVLDRCKMQDLVVAILSPIEAQGERPHEKVDKAMKAFSDYLDQLPDEELDAMIEKIDAMFTITRNPK